MNENEKLPFEEETYSTDLNGYVDFTTVPESQQKVTYQNFVDRNTNNQKIISLTDIASCCFIRKNDKGELEFALIETITPSTLGRDGYSGITLEVPFFALPQKEAMTYEDIVDIIDKGILDLNLYMESNSVLDDTKTSIHQSFTNQSAQFYVSGVSSRTGNCDDRLHWFPLSSLSSYLQLQLNGGMDNVHSSLSTLYALKLLEGKYKEELSKMPSTTFQLDKPVSTLELIEKKTIVKNSPRFTLVDVKYQTENGEVAYSTYADSKDSIEAILLVEDDTHPGQYNLVVSKQQRSPFVMNPEFPNGILNEFTGGMIEKDQTIEETVIAEAVQEQTYSLESGNLAVLAKPFVASLSSSEFGSIFLAFANKDKRTKQQLDMDENSTEAISNKRTYLPLHDVAKNIHLLEPTHVAVKLGVLLTEDYVREMEKSKENIDKFER